MRKSILFAVAGIGVILAGCNASNHRYQMIPVDDPGASDYPAVRKPASRPMEQPIEIKDPVVKPEKVTPVAPKYVPMTDVKSSGGVDDANGKKAASESKTTIHTVRRGENPSIIAKKYGVSTTALLKANNLDEKSATRLRVGQVITIPGKAGNVNVADNKKVSTDNKKVTTETSGEVDLLTIETAFYDVTEEMTYGQLAAKLGEKESLLRALNGNDQSSSIPVGSVLLVPKK